MNSSFTNFEANFSLEQLLARRYDIFVGQRPVVELLLTSVNGGVGVDTLVGWGWAAGVVDGVWG